MSSEGKVSVLGSDVAADAGTKTVFKVLLAISFCHLLNDTVQSLLPAIYPLLRDTFYLDFGQIGLISFTTTFTASLLQPLVGLYSDKHHKPNFLAIGMGITLIGLVTLSLAPSYGTVLVAAGLVGIGSSVFHPESSRVARMASGGQHGMAQSLFQVGGNAGSAMGPLLAAFILPRGQRSIAWFSFVALLGIILLADIGAWTKRRRAAQEKLQAAPPPLAGHVVEAADAEPHAHLPRKTIFWSLAVLVALMFSKYFYLASLGSYYTFYLMDKFHVSVRSAEIHLFAFLGAVAAGTFFGGPVGDRMGRKVVIWYSILGVLPFTLVLPYANLFWTGILSVVIGLILASAFSTILVFAQELVPTKVGTISGTFFGLAFGLGGIGAALLGKLADATNIRFVYHVCSFLPAVGILTAFLPDLNPGKSKESR
ncbi:MAG: major facilitator superfamily 1 [Candidatus Acidoferrum typicum]|nr:major facilitator superfamily 1 [Candidatus Acidoferrum typicum]